MKVFIRSIFIFIIVFILSNNSIVGADILYRFMHNDHDVLVIGKVLKYNDYTFTLKVSEIIVSNNSISNKKQLTNISEIIQIKNENISNYVSGDYIAASLNKTETTNRFQVSNGIYRLTSNNTDTLEVIDSSGNLLRGENAAVEVFLKSRGVYTEFYFNEKGVYLYDTPNKASDKDRLIYDKIGNKKVSIDIKDKNSKILVTETNKFNISEFIYNAIFYLFLPVIITLVFFNYIKKYFIKKNNKYFFKKIISTIGLILTTIGFFIVSVVLNYAILYIIIIGFLYKG